MRKHARLLHLFSLALLLLIPQVAYSQMMHPPIILLDEEGVNVLQSGEAVDPLETCGGCHDAEYISTHGYHGAAGYLEGKPEAGRSWDLSPGLFGRWDPLTYDRLSAPEDEYHDLNHAEWIQSQARHVGGGPASYKGFPRYHQRRSWEIEVVPSQNWDYSASGSSELNCFLCHIEEPNNEARLDELKEGRFEWAVTATLENLSIPDDPRTAYDERAPLLIQNSYGAPYSYNSRIFDEDGRVPNSVLNIRDPRDANCGQCHGQARAHGEVVNWEPGLVNYATETLGQIISPQRINQSLMNIKDKSSLSRPWDVHAERMLECSHCHYSANNPAAYSEWEKTRPDHLRHEARTLNIGEYLYRPSHNFAKGDSAQSTVANNLDNSMRRCENCHDAMATHDWLPFKERHMQAMLCETCHIPRVYAPARQQTDWTMLTAQGEPLVKYRGIEGDPKDPASLVTGYAPVMLPRPNPNGPNKLTPHNLITSWYWVQHKGGEVAPVRREDLEQAFLVGGGYHPDLIAALDEDGDGQLQGHELQLRSAEKVEAAKARLIAVGVVDPEVRGEIQPYSLHHMVATGDFVVRECTSCHSNDSHLTQPMELSSYVPYGAEAHLVLDTNVSLSGAVEAQEGRLVFSPSTLEAGLYLMGHDSTKLADILGILSLIAVFLGVSIHGGLRYMVARRKRSES